MVISLFLWASAMGSGVASNVERWADIKKKRKGENVDRSYIILTRVKYPFDS
jgi:hypothetical protein